MAEMQIRSALASDWPAIHALLLENKLPPDGARDHLASFLVACDDNGLVACGGLEMYGTAALLRSVAVAQTHRGRGIGRTLVQGLMALARRENVQVLALLTETAEPYFRRLGFEVAPRSGFPPALMASAEFRGACPASAIAMLRAMQ